MKKILILLSGCGVYDGTEIQEAVLSMLAIEEAGGVYECCAPDQSQAQVVNHVTGEVIPESRNIKVEAARIARGKIVSTTEIKVEDYQGLLLPGGFGAAKNLTHWAFEGAAGSIEDSVKSLILQFIQAKKPILALCMAPVVVAKALEGSGLTPQLTVGSTEEPTPYDINSIAQGMESLESQVHARTLREIQLDSTLRIITAPCYMMEGNIQEINSNIKQAVAQLMTWA
jgi:enhancing lycopene biosynthesis protein 2